MAFPIFSREEIIGVFSFFALYVAITTLVGKTPPGRVALLLLIILVSYIITFYLHKGYIDIILCLQVENDTDSLTGLCNRRAGMDIMYRILAICNRAHMFCVVYMIDIDFFKSFNDTFGHLSGDSALKSIASCIQRQFSRPGDVVCRFGGEEFAVMAIMSGERAATQQAEQLLEKIRDMQIPSAQKSLSEFLTISVGCVCFWPEGLAEITSEDSLTAVLTKADAELYKAKQGGRNRISLRLLGPSEKTP
jgi:diguanylate cyclase (GGDEF)-like protein